MTLRSFHIFFISISVLLSLFLGVFELNLYQQTKAVSDAVVSGVSFAAALALAVYGIRFWMKGRQNA